MLLCCYVIIMSDIMLLCYYVISFTSAAATLAASLSSSLALSAAPERRPIHDKRYIGVVSVDSQYMVYNCVYYCDTCYLCNGI
jgi:hypothetical protein